MSQSAPDWKIAILAFLEGFTTPSQTGALAMIAGIVTSLIFSIWFFSPAAMIGPTGDYLPRSERDSAGFVTIDAMRLGARSAERPTLLLLGSSVIAQMVENGDSLRRALNEGTGEDWDVHVLTTPLQSPLDQFSLLDTALKNQGSDSAPVVIAIGAGLMRPAWTRERLLSEKLRHRIGLTSEWFDTEITKLGGQTERRTGFYVFDQIRFIALNGTEALIRFVLNSPAKRLYSSYAIGSQQAPGERKNPILRDAIAVGIKNQEEYFAQQGRLAERLKNIANTQLVYLGEPIAPDLIYAFKLQESQVSIRKALKQNAKAIGATYFPVDEKADLVSADFFDALHINTGVPQKITQRIISTYLLNWWNKRKRQ